MTNYEWVKENQEDVIQKALARNMTIHKDEVINMIINNDDVVKESIISYCSVDKHANKIVVGEMTHIDDRHYLFNYNDVAEWLDKEREIPLLYPIGTAVTAPDGEIWFYNGRTKHTMKHCYVGNVHRIGTHSYSDPELPSGIEYENEEAKIYFKPVRLIGLKIVDGYVNGKEDE